MKQMLSIALTHGENS